MFSNEHGFHNDRVRTPAQESPVAVGHPLTPGITVTTAERVYRQQILREAEGYLDLLLLFGDGWTPSQPVRQRLAERSLHLLEKLPEHAQQGAAAQHLRGQAFRVLDRFHDAIEPLQVAASSEPQNIHIWLALGWCYKRIGRLDLAIESLEEAQVAKPNLAIIHYNLACYWSLANNKARALQYLGHALQIDPDYRELVHREHDFDTIRDDPEFRQMTALMC
jgi:tetratricopeptide (TPR) repeat protein